MKHLYLIPIVLIFFFHLLNIHSFAQPNPDFENKLQSWNPTGTAFSDQPEHGNTVRTYRVRQEISDSIGGDYWRGIPHSIGHHGNYWITSYKINKEDSVSANDSLGNLPAGTLTSGEFTISSDRIYFLIGGNGGSVELWIKNRENIIESSDSINDDIVLSDNYYIVDSRVPLNGIEVMGREYFDTHFYKNQRARLRITDSSKTGHINVDDFCMIGNDTGNIKEYKFRTSYSIDSANFHKLNYIKERDTNLPVWGYIDTHAHWMNNAGFGGDLIFGKPYGDIDTALKDCSDIHGSDGMGFGNFILGKSFLIRFINEGVRKYGHITSGYPDFTGWPSFRSLIHQAMYVDWVRRAYEGGLRLMVCPMGNNLILADLTKNFFDDNDNSDTAAVRIEVEYIKKMINVLRPEGWIDFAYNSEDANRLIMENKLVIILGMEVDQPGGFLYLDSINLEKNKVSINNYINYIYNDLGIRHMFPLHHADNAFGGFSLYDSDRFAINNFQLKNLKDITPTSLRYVVVDSSSLVSFRLGKEKGIFTRENMAQLVPLYNPPGTDNSYDGNYYGDQFRGKGHINKRGLTKNGKTLIESMIRHGMIIDIDHMSMNTTNDLLNFLDTNITINRTDTVNYNQYPVLAGHTNFLSQKFFNYQTSDCESCQKKIKDEHARTDDMLNKIRRLGGIVCPITEGDKDVHPGIFKFECPGSSKYFAEAYLYALEKMDNKNVGIGTDMNGFGIELCPRFATFSSYGLMGDLIRQKEIGNRRYLALNQDNGVKYKNNLEDCGAHKFSGSDIFSKKEIKIWQAIFAAHSYRITDLTKFQKKIVKGIRTALGSMSEQHSEYEISGEVEAAGFILAKKYECNTIINTDSMVSLCKLNIDTLYNQINLIDSIYRSYDLLNGSNIPLKRCEIITKHGIRDFDYNIDGLANYGLLPDFLQDLKNIGVPYDKLSVLFNSAGDFAIMMGKCEAVAKKLRSNR